MSSHEGRDPVADLETLEHELAAYDERLASRPRIVVATKIDALDEPRRLARLEAAAARRGVPFRAVSSVRREGLRELVATLAQAVFATPRNGDPGENAPDGDVAAEEPR